LVQRGTHREVLTKFYQRPKVPSMKTKTNTYSVSEQKDKNRHGPSKQFRPKLQRKEIINEKKEYIWHGPSN